MHLFSVSRNRKSVGCSEGCKTPKYEICKVTEERGATNREGAFIRINTVYPSCYIEWFHGNIRNAI